MIDIKDFPAFPSAAFSPMGDSIQQNGMLMRDYLIAHAPLVPEWFKVDRIDRPPIYKWFLVSLKDQNIKLYDELSNHYDSESDDWYKAVSCDDDDGNLTTQFEDYIPSKEAVALLAEWNKAHREKDLEEKEYEEKRYFAWREYYADKCLFQIFKNEIESSSNDTKIPVGRYCPYVHSDGKPMREGDKFRFSDGSQFEVVFCKVQAMFGAYYDSWTDESDVLPVAICNIHKKDTVRL